MIHPQTAHPTHGRRNAGRTGLLVLAVLTAMAFGSACSSKKAPAKAPNAADKAAKGNDKAAKEAPKAKGPWKKKVPIEIDKDFARRARNKVKVPMASPRKALERPRTPKELPTTPFDLMVRTLRGQVNTSFSALERAPKSVAAHAFHGAKLLSLAKLEGDLSEIDKASRIATDGLKLQPKSPQLLALRIEANFSLHRWDTVAKDLAQLKAIKADHDMIAPMEAELAWNRGDIKTAAAMFSKIARDAPSMGSVARLAGALQTFGKLKEADQGFARAETLYTNSSPVPLAWLYVQRGLLRLHSGRFKDARVFYQAAHERAPGYPMATEHLAEIEFLLGNTDRALELYKAVIKQTDNPEFHVAIAGVYDSLGKKKEAAEHMERAKARNLELMKKFPEAMSGHGADFFLEDGQDASIALKLLSDAAKSRPNPESFQALAEAQLANDKLKEAQETIDKALNSPLSIAEIYWTGARVAKAKGDQAKTEELKKKALALNPKISVLEGDL